MGQSSSTIGVLSDSYRRNGDPSHQSKIRSSPVISPMQVEENSSFHGGYARNRDISDLPDECLACIFQYLSSGDRNKCAIVSRRWYLVEGQSRHRLSLKVQSDLLPLIPSLFSRFDAVTKLALKFDRRSASISEEALVLISLRCPSLTRLKLRACRELTDSGMAVFAKNCKNLKKLSCGHCTFGSKGMNAILDHCSGLEQLSVKRLRGNNVGAVDEQIGPGVAASSLTTICMKEVYNGQSFEPLINGSINLKTLKLIRCYGDWDRILEVTTQRGSNLVQIHLERLQISDHGLSAISNCLDLEILHLVKTSQCTNLGLISVADRCKLLRKLHIDGWKTNQIGDEGLIAIAKNCHNLQELVLIGVNPTCLSLSLIASNCPKLERLALCGSETIGDAEISCIAAKCTALKKLCIKGCPISDHGIETLAFGCPNLIKVKVRKCRGVTCEGADLLREIRGSLAVHLDSGDIENPDASTSGIQENGLVLPIMASEIAFSDIPSSSNGGSTTRSKSRLGFFSGRNFVACSFRRWSNDKSSSFSD